MRAKFNKISIQVVNTDVVQDTLPPSTAPWHAKYFERELRKQQEQSGHSDRPSPFPLEAGINTLTGEVPSLCSEKEAALARDKGTPRKSKPTGLAERPQVTIRTSRSLACHTPPRPPALQTEHKNTQSASFSLHFLTKAPVSCKMHIK